MAVNFNGGFKVGGVEHHHPLSADEIRYLLTILGRTPFTGEEMENVVIVTMKLQEEYKRVSDIEEKNK